MQTLQEHRPFEHRAHDADADVRAECTDEHQRVTRSRAEGRAGVERRADAEENESRCQEPGAVRAATIRGPGANPSCCTRTTKRPIRAAFASGRRPGLEPSDQAGRARPRGRTGWRAAGERCVVRDPLVRHVPRRQPKARLEERNDAAGAEEEAGDEPDRTRGTPATQDGSRVHRRTLVEGCDQNEGREEPHRGCQIRMCSCSGTHAAFVSRRFGIR